MNLWPIQINGPDNEIPTMPIHVYKCSMLDRGKSSVLYDLDEKVSYFLFFYPFKYLPIHIPRSLTRTCRSTLISRAGIYLYHFTEIE